MKMWDLYVPISHGKSPTVEYDRALEYVVESVSPLGEEYENGLKDGVNSGWIDVYENRGKYSGSYSGVTYDTKPFILMNYQEGRRNSHVISLVILDPVNFVVTWKKQLPIYKASKCCTKPIYR